MKKLNRATQALLTLSAAALLVACGSGNNETAVSLVSGTDVPTSATTSSTAATDFVRTVVAKGEADTETALIVGDAVLAASETDDPVAI